MKNKKLIIMLLLSLIAAYIVYFKIDDNFIINKKYDVNQEVINSIITNNITSEMSDYDKVKAIHDYIVSTTEYDHINLQNNTIPDLDYTAKGVLVNHIGVCRGYAEAFKLLMDELNIGCNIVTGYVGSVSHAWNVVKIDNEWYHIDCTYDDPVDEEETQGSNNYLRYDYFLVTTEQILLDHVPDSIKYSCTSDKYMYQEKEKDVPYCILESVQCLPSTISYYFNSGKNNVTFYFPENADLSDVNFLNKISQVLGYSNNVSQFSYTPILKCGKYYYTTMYIK